MRKIILLFLVLLLSSCTHKILVSDMKGLNIGEGEANEIGKTVNITVEGEPYSGNYVFSRFGRTGKTIVKSPSGKQLVCDFIYDDSYKGIGSCEGENGKKYPIEIPY